jgi:hypothetical protein
MQSMVEINNPTSYRTPQAVMITEASFGSHGRLDLRNRTGAVKPMDVSTIPENSISDFCALSACSAYVGNEATR